MHFNSSNPFPFFRSFDCQMMSIFKRHSINVSILATLYCRNSIGDIDTLTQNKGGRTSSCIVLKNASTSKSILEDSFHNKRQCTQVQRTELNYHFIYDWLARFFSLCDCSLRDMEIIFTLSQLWERIRTIFYKTLVIYDDFGCKYTIEKRFDY